MKKKLIVMLFSISLGLVNVANATENGGVSYPNGIESEMSGVVPPAGWYYINYLRYYSADKSNDANGNDTTGGNLGLTSVSNTSRFFLSTDKKIFGGNYSFNLALTTVDVEVTSVPSFVGNSDSGLADISVTPIGLSWMPSKSFHHKVGLEFILPVGSYDEDKAINVGRNVFTTTLFYGATYFMGDWHTSGFFKYDINQENEATNIKSGDEFHFDYSIGKHFGKQASPFSKEWSLGLGGYYYQQVTGDSGSGNTSGSNKGKVVAIGPEISYTYDKGILFMLKHHVEVEAENKTQGTASVFKFVYAF